MQVQALRSKGIKTETLNSTLTASERSRVITDIKSSNSTTKLLYITPEGVAANLSLLGDLYHSGARPLLLNDIVI